MDTLGCGSYLPVFYREKSYHLSQFLNVLLFEPVWISADIGILNAIP